VITSWLFQSLPSNEFSGHLSGDCAVQGLVVLLRPHVCLASSFADRCLLPNSEWLFDACGPRTKPSFL